MLEKRSSAIKTLNLSGSATQQQQRGAEVKVTVHTPRLRNAPALCED